MLVEKEKEKEELRGIERGQHGSNRANQDPRFPAVRLQRVLLMEGVREDGVTAPDVCYSYAH
jgi:hypothetical protein